MNQTEYEIIPLGSLITGILGIILFGGATLLIVILNFSIILELNTTSIAFIIMIVIFFSFLLMSLLVTLYCQKIFISDIEISIKRLNRKYTLQYSEISYCYISSGNINIGNNNKQISFPSFEYWFGKNKRDAITLMIQSLDERKIEPKTSIKGMFPHIKGY